MSVKFDPSKYTVTAADSDIAIRSFMMSQRFETDEVVIDLENKQFTLGHKGTEVVVACNGDYLTVVTPGYGIELVGESEWRILEGEDSREKLANPAPEITVDLPETEDTTTYFLEYTCPECGGPRGVRRVNKEQFDAVTGLISVGEAHEHCSWEVKHEYDEDSLFKLRPQSCCPQY